MTYPLNLENIKNYLRVDYADDDLLIELFVDTAKQYIADAVGGFNELSPRHNTILLAVVAQLYQNRTLQGQSSGKITHIIQSMLTQAQLDEYEVSEDED